MAATITNDNSMSSTLKTNSDFVDVFSACTQKMFETMLGWDVVLSERHASKGFWAKHDVSGLIGFSGKLRGSLVLSVVNDVAFAAAEAFLGERPSEINDEVIDMVGELTNMIGGSSKDRLGIAGVELGLPAVVAGQSHRVSFQPSAHVEILCFESPNGPFTVEIGLRKPG